MRLIRAIFRGLFGLALGALAALALMPAVSAFSQDHQNATWSVPLVVIVFTTALCVLAPTIRRAIGRGFLVFGASVFALPISFMLLSGRASIDAVKAAGPDATEKVGAIAGSTLGSIAVTGISGIVGLFFGTILLVIGLVLVLGGRREVTIAKA